MKYCYKCQGIKCVSLFSKNKCQKDGLSTMCKECSKEYMSLYYKKNKVSVLKTQSNYYKNNKESIDKKNKIYTIKNIESIRSTRNNTLKEKRKNDPLFKLSSNIRTLIRISFNGNGFKKGSKTNTILGCSFDEFKLHIENQFEDWMTWDNYGNINGNISKSINISWDFDHIIPLSRANNYDELIKLNHYSNIQPLCSYTNRYIKSNN